MKILAEAYSSADAAAATGGLVMLCLVVGALIVAIVWVMFPFVVMSKFNEVLRELRKMTKVGLIAAALIVAVGAARAETSAEIAQRWNHSVDKWLEEAETILSQHLAQQFGDSNMREAVALMLEMKRVKMQAELNGGTMPLELIESAQRNAPKMEYIVGVLNCWQDYPESGCVQR